MEITDIPLIRDIARTNKPMIISTGMASTQEIDDAYGAATVCGKEPAFLHCVSGYPANPKEFNLQRLRSLFSTGGSYVAAGISDHTAGIEMAIAAVAMGANIIEKHLMIHKECGSEDEAFSLEPHEFSNMVKAARNIWHATQYSEISSEKASRQLRRSLYVTANVKKGERFTRDNVRSIRPSYGLSPVFLDQVLGNIATCDLERGTALRMIHLEKQPEGQHAMWQRMWSKPITQSNEEFREIKQ